MRRGILSIATYSELTLLLMNFVKQPEDELLPRTPHGQVL